MLKKGPGLRSSFPNYYVVLLFNRSSAFSKRGKTNSGFCSMEAAWRLPRQAGNRAVLPIRERSQRIKASWNQYFLPGLRRVLDAG
jgi:hypothetical protein